MGCGDLVNARQWRIAGQDALGAAREHTIQFNVGQTLAPLATDRMFGIMMMVLLFILLIGLVQKSCQQSLHRCPQNGPRPARVVGSQSRAAGGGGHFVRRGVVRGAFPAPRWKPHGRAVVGQAPGLAVVTKCSAGRESSSGSRRFPGRIGAGGQRRTEQHSLMGRWWVVHSSRKGILLKSRNEYPTPVPLDYQDHPSPFHH